MEFIYNSNDSSCLDILRMYYEVGGTDFLNKLFLEGTVNTFEDFLEALNENSSAIQTLTELINKEREDICLSFIDLLKKLERINLSLNDIKLIILPGGGALMVEPYLKELFSRLSTENQIEIFRLPGGMTDDLFGSDHIQKYAKIIDDVLTKKELGEKSTMITMDFSEGGGSGANMHYMLNLLTNLENIQILHCLKPVGIKGIVGIYKKIKERCEDHNIDYVQIKKTLPKRIPIKLIDSLPVLLALPEDLSVQLLNELPVLEKGIQEILNLDKMFPIESTFFMDHNLIREKVFGLTYQENSLGKNRTFDDYKESINKVEGLQEIYFKQASAIINEVIKRFSVG